MSVRHKFSSEYAYLIMCLCTFGTVSGLRAFRLFSGCCSALLPPLPPLVDSMIIHGVAVMVCSVCCCSFFFNRYLICVFLCAHCAPDFSSGLCAVEISCIIIISSSSLCHKYCW